ncbi:hypothetical protein [Staphylococcus chromogenes]|uniref:hypothetical protein n=1 Tax=Staphylococcus chromogenes TaxID=46126 RepID=UPI003D7A3E76
MKKYLKMTLPFMLIGTMTLTVSTELSANAATSTSKTMVAQETAHLSQTQKVALAYYIKGYERYTFTRQEIKNGKYTVRWMNNEKYVYPLKTIYLVKQSNKSKNGVKSMEGAPKDMVFYHVLPSKSNFATVVGVSRTQVVIGGTQNASSYKDFVKGAKVENLQTLYRQYHKDPLYARIAHQMVIRTTYPHQ